MLRNGNSFEEYPVDVGILEGTILGPKFFLLNINVFPDNVMSNIAIYVVDTTLHSKCEQTSDLRQQLKMASELKSDVRDFLDWGGKWLVDFNAEKTQLALFDPSHTSDATDGRVYSGGKTSFKFLGFSFFSKLDCRFYIISIAKTASKTIRALMP